MDFIKKPRVKLLILGDSGVGKSSILLRYTEQKFNHSHITTIGLDFKSKTIEIDGKQIELQVWDTAGHEKYRVITHTYYQGSAGVILAYDCSDQKSFDNATKWVEQIRNNLQDDVPKVLVACKVDRPDRKISRSDGENLANNLNLLYFETSAKTNIGIDETFEYLAKQCFERGIFKATGIKLEIYQHDSKCKC
jgi:small GTP-binding protein